jgi:hypothetical protein
LLLIAGGKIVSTDSGMILCTVCRLGRAGALGGNIDV